MGYILQDRLEISLFFSGQEFPLNAYNSLSFLQIDISSKLSLPQVTFVVTDAAMVLTKNGYLQDNAQFSIVMKPLGSDTSTTYNFRIFKFKEAKMLNGTRYQVDGYWDALSYWLTTTNTAIQGTSDSVISQIASTCGLQYSGTSTSDAQLWVPQNRSYANWVRNLTLHGYTTDKSLMVSGVDIVNGTPTLLYKDFNAISTTPIDVSIGQASSSSVVCVDFRPYANAGPTNKNSGYFQTRYFQSAAGSADQTAYGSMDVSPTTRSPLYSLDARAVAQRGTMLYSGIDFGNVNPNAYEKGRYLNSRGAGLLSAKIDLLTILPSQIRLFDRINVVSRNESEGAEVDNTWSGLYTVTSLSYRIDTTNYSEVIEGYRDGTNVVDQA